MNWAIYGRLRFRCPHRDGVVVGIHIHSVLASTNFQILIGWSRRVDGDFIVVDVVHIRKVFSVICVLKV